MSILDWHDFTFTRPEREPDLELVGYLHRWCLTPRNGQGNIYLHHIIGPDEPVYHDHPWNFRSIVLSGGYWERRPTGAVSRHTVGDTFVRGAQEGHYIDRLDSAIDTWTILFTGPVIREWGFWIDGKWVHHDDHTDARGIEIITRNGYTP